MSVAVTLAMFKLLCYGFELNELCNSLLWNSVDACVFCALRLLPKVWRRVA